MHWIAWTPLAAAVVHIAEEFVWPGGFAGWDRQYRPQLRRTITPRFHVIINGLLLVACYDVGTLGLTRVGVAAWLTVMALLFSNAIWHILGAFRTRSYSPGMVTGVALYMPLAFYGFGRFVADGQASLLTAVMAFAVGASYHLWVGTALHRWRAGRSDVHSTGSGRAHSR
jgi:Protein of unknown function with HXXEE motif